MTKRDTELTADALLALKEGWSIETPPELFEQVMERLPTKAAQPVSHEQELFGLVAWNFVAMCILSGALGVIAHLYTRQSQDLMLALFWGGFGL